MKNFRSFRYILLVFTLVLGSSVVSAQSNKDEEAGKKAAIEAERKAIQEEQMKARKEMLEKQQQEMKAQQREMHEIEKQYREQTIEFEQRARESERARESIRSSGRSVYRIPGEPFFIGSYDQGNQSQLTLRNSFSGGSDTSKGEFDVDEDVRRFRCIISGKVKSGEISIQVNYPSGKVFKYLTINSSAEISFSQSLTIKEGEEDKYIGEWGYEVKAENAAGNYMLQIMTD